MATIAQETDVAIADFVVVAEMDGTWMECEFKKTQDKKVCPPPVESHFKALQDCIYLFILDILMYSAWGRGSY